MEEVNSLLAFLERVKLGMKFTKYYEDKDQHLLAKNFNSMDFVRWDENKVSEIIGFLLNPSGEHSQGSTYIELFLMRFVSNMKLADKNAIAVILEDRTFEDRRIDIVLSYKKYQKVIGIENKINLTTKDQERQVADYMFFLEEIVKNKHVEDNNYMLFYLTPKGRKLAKESGGDKVEQWKEEGKLVHITYEDDIIPFLEDCIKETRNDRVRYFIIDFTKQLIENYMGKEDTNQSLVLSQLNDSENIKAAFIIQNTLNHFKQELRDKLNIQMQELADELTEELKQEVKYIKEHHHFEIPQLEKTHIKYSYEMNGVIYGLVKKHEYYTNKNCDKMHIAGLNHALGIKFKISNWWPCYAFEYENIEVTAEFWIDIQSGRFRDFIRTFILKVINLDRKYLEQL